MNSSMKRFAKVIVAVLLSALTLAGCSTGGISPDMEIDTVLFYRTGGDVDRTEVFDFKPDLQFFGERVIPLMEQAGLRFKAPVSA